MTPSSLVLSDRGKRLVGEVEHCMRELVEAEVGAGSIDPHAASKRLQVAESALSDYIAQLEGCGGNKEPLTDAEIAVLLMELEHAPSCVWSQPAEVHFVDKLTGQRWADSERTVPWVPPECTCGYFALLEQARGKLRRARA